MGLLSAPLSPGLSLVVALFAIAVVLTQVVNDPPAVAGGNGPDQAVGIWLAGGWRRADGGGGRPGHGSHLLAVETAPRGRAGGRGRGRVRGGH